MVACRECRQPVLELDAVYVIIIAEDKSINFCQDCARRVGIAHVSDNWEAWVASEPHIELDWLERHNWLVSAR